MIYSTKPMQQESWQQRRAAVRVLMHAERFEELPIRYPKDIYWNYW